jgi:hypothetical protein
MEPQTVRKPYKYRLYLTPEQERMLDTVLWRCRTLYNVALEERKTAWEQRRARSTTNGRRRNRLI